MSKYPDAATELRTRSPVELWGVSPESIYLSMCAVTNDVTLTQALLPHHKATVLRTNDERDPNAVATVHRYFQEELALITDDGHLTDRGRFVLTTKRPSNAVRILAVSHLRRSRQLLRELSTLDSERIPRSEFRTLLRDDYDETIVAPLLSSLGFIDQYPEGVIIHQGTIEDAMETLERDHPRLVNQIALVNAVTSLCNPKLVVQVAASLAGADIDNDSAGQVEAIDALAAGGSQQCERTPTTEIVDAIEDVRNSVTSDADILEKALGLTDAPVEQAEAHVDADTITDALRDDVASNTVTIIQDLLTTVSSHPTLQSISLSPITRETELAPYQLYRALSAIPGVKCRLQEDLLITFERVPTATSGMDRHEHFRETLFEALHNQLSWRDLLSDVEIVESPRMKSEVVESILTRLEGDEIAPTYFVYTLPDPDALGEERMEQYVDDNPGLRRERARLKRWKDKRDDDIRRFTEMTDRLFAHGQERNLEERIVRIMTPYNDDTFSEYTSQLRSLLREGYELRLLTRHTRQRWQWERLRDNLLGDLEENREKVTIRTYSRYKEYQRITNETDAADLSEFGIHAKLQTIGHETEGAALLGSANFMENSYNWNPECGVYTESANFVAAAIEFFDHVWEISEADEVDLTSLQEIPKRSFYPSYYT